MNFAKLCKNQDGVSFLDRVLLTGFQRAHIAGHSSPVYSPKYLACSGILHGITILSTPLYSNVAGCTCRCKTWCLFKAFFHLYKYILILLLFFSFL